MHELTLLAVYPETRNRSLESIESLFSTSSPFHWRMEQAYKLHGDVLAQHGATNRESFRAGKTESTPSNNLEPEQSNCSCSLSANPSPLHV
jgi:hypothetical protein